MQKMFSALLLLLALWIPSGSAEAHSCESDKIWPDPAPSDLEITIEGSLFESGCRVEDRSVDQEEAISIRIKNFNFFHFKPTLDTEITEIKSYQYLETLWSQLLGFDLSAIVTTTFNDRQVRKAANAADDETLECEDGSTFEDCAVKWLKLLRQTTEKLQSGLSGIKDKISLTTTDTDPLERLVKDYSAKLEHNHQLALELVKTLDEIQSFELIEKRHQELMAAIQAFFEAADLVKNGQVFNIKAQKPGSAVVATIGAESLSGATPSTIKPVVLDYFVHSKHGLTYHVGLAYTEVDDFDFETVRALDGRDLFSEVKKDEGDENLVAFLSYEFTSWGKKRQGGFYGTLGTNLDEVGERLYVGLSVRFARRWFVTVGGTSVETTMGEEMTMEMEMDMNGEPTGRELFAELSEDRTWEAFVAFSVSLF